MTRNQLTKLATIYGCHVMPGAFFGAYHTATVIEIHSPSYSEKREIRLGELEYKQATDIIPILKELSGVNLAQFWTGGAS